MRGLLLKDFYIIRSGLFILLITFIFVGTGMAVVISPWVLIVIFTVTLSFQSAVTIQNDKSSQWNKFSVTLPLTRKQIISSKYMMYFLLSFAGLMAGIMVSLVCSLFQSGLEINSLVLYSGMAVVVSLLPGCISIPCSFLLDEEKSMVGTVLSYMFTSGMIAAAIFIAHLFINIKENIGIVIGILDLISVILYALSWSVCSSKICEKDW